jgi:hypothetical protein
MSRVKIQNTQPEPRPGAPTEPPLIVKQTGHGPPQTSELPSGGEVEMTVEPGRKITISVQGEEDD